MARSGIGKQQVFEAATQLSEEGTRPTVQNVRERIGSGSYSTITGHLAAWKEQNAAALQVSPPAIPDDVQSAFARIWAVASKAAHDALDQQREAFEVLRQDIETEKLEMAAEIERLEQALDEQTRHGDLKAAECDELKQTVSTATETVNTLKIENTRLGEQRRAAVQRGEDLTAGLAQLRAGTGAEIARLEKAQEREAEQGAKRTAERDEYRQQVMAQGEEISALKVENTRLAAQKSAEQVRSTELKTQLDTLQDEFAQAVKAMQHSAAKPTAKRGRKAQASDPAPE